MPKQNTYQLINPVIEGSFNDVFDAKEPIVAAEKMWEELSSHIANHVPNFLFTLKDVSRGDLFHFQVNEKAKNGKYGIRMREDINVEKKDIDNFLKNIDKFNAKQNKKKGGAKRKRYQDDSSDSDDSSDYYPTIRRTSPIAVFHYNSRIYYTPSKVTIEKPFTTLNPQIVGFTTDINVPVFTPAFLPPLSPFVAIWP